MYLHKSLITLCLSTLVCGKLNDQADKNLKDLIKNTLNTTIVWDRLAEMTDTYGHRLVGSKSLEDSIDWLVKLIKKDGINVYTEPVKVDYWRREKESLRLLTDSRGEVDLKVRAIGNSVSTPNDGISGEVIPITSLDDLDKLLNKDKDAIRGKIILYDFSFDYYSNLSISQTRDKNPEDYGAVATIWRSAAPFGLNNVNALYEIFESKIPSVTISIEDAALLHRMYKRASKQLSVDVLDHQHILFPKVHLDIQVKFSNNTHTSRNIIAEIKGTDYPDEYIILGGHIDSWDLGVGALDDGGGSFTAYEALRQISKLALKPKRTIQVVFWTSEENGGIGGIEFAKKRENIFDKMVFVMESDFNSARSDGIGFTGNAKQEAFLKETATTYLKPHGFGFNVVEGYFGFDIDPICKEGKIPCAGFNSVVPVKNTYFNTTMGENNEAIPDGYFWYYHSDADRMEALKPDQLAECSATMATYVYAIAQNDESLHKMK